MNTWSIIGYIFLGCATIVLVFAAYIFFNLMFVASQIPVIGQSLTSIALAAAVPYLVLAAIMYVIGGTSYYAGIGKVTTPLPSSNAPETTTDDVATPLMSSDKREMTTDETLNEILNRLKRLEGIVDNNFLVVSKRLDEIEEKQKLASQTTLIKASKE